MTPTRTAPLDVRAAVRRPLARALAALRSSEPLAAASVHRVRKELKRARAGLRLLRKVAGKPAFARENLRLRDAARPLAALRDADVMSATLVDLLARDIPPRQRDVLLQLRSRARREAAALRRQAPGLADIAHALHATRTHMTQLRLVQDPRPALRAGFERIFRQGSKAFAVARENATDRNLHEARKHLKYLGAVVEFLLRAAPDPAPRLARLGRRAAAAAEALGHDHDLAVLRGHLGRGAGGGPLAGIIERRRSALQKLALKEARCVYRSRPAALRAFARSLQGLPKRDLS